MSKIVFALVALVAMIGVVFAMAPVQLSGNVGKNISANLTDDVTFMHVDGLNGTSVVTVYSYQDAARAGNLVNGFTISNGNVTYY